VTLNESHWTETEFDHLDPGDTRLNKRARTLMERLAAKPTAGVPHACRGSEGEPIGEIAFTMGSRHGVKARQVRQRLGGFLGRKGDGEPGAKAIRLGLNEFHVAAKTLQALRTGGRAENCV
jgi:Transposase DNA-binding/Transposase Tn5 dimerisation domain